jgi:hypothetical protein
MGGGARASCLGRARAGAGGQQRRGEGASAVLCCAGVWGSPAAMAQPQGGRARRPRRRRPRCRPKRAAGDRAGARGAEPQTKRARGANTKGGHGGRHTWAIGGLSPRARGFAAPGPAGPFVHFRRVRRGWCGRLWDGRGRGRGRGARRPGEGARGLEGSKSHHTHTDFHRSSRALRGGTPSGKWAGGRRPFKFGRGEEVCWGQEARGAKPLWRQTCPGGGPLGGGNGVQGRRGNRRGARRGGASAPRSG